MRRRKLKNVKECRHCKAMFRWIKGIKQLDEGCCTEACFLYAGPKPVEEVMQKHNVSAGFKKNKSRKSKSWERKKQKQQRVNARKGFYTSDEWLALRYQVIAKYGRTCMACGATKGEMHVDHIQPRSIRPDLELVFSNLQILCRGCNLGKSNRDNKDFRPQESLDSTEPTV